MGFGILFLGYLINLNTLVYPGFTKILGYLVMLLAMTKLAAYNRPLKSAFCTMIPTAVLGVFYLLLEVAALFSLLPTKEEELLFRLIPLAAYALELVFCFFLFRGLQALAEETEVRVLEVRAFRNRIFTTVYYLLFLAGQFNYGESSALFLVRYNIAILLVGIVIAFLNLKMIYSFYMWICLPEDLSMDKGGFSLPGLGRLSAKLDEMQERRAKEMAEERRYRAERKKKRKDKK
ncbi:MAG: hypothetical protein IKC73_01020 [Clostridia bacterium]|nr:hypothetical protein [Clostridia bacterium]